MLLSWTAHVSIHVSRQPIVGSSQVSLAFVVDPASRIYGLTHQTFLLALSAPPAFPFTWVTPSLCSSSGWCGIRVHGGLRARSTCSRLTPDAPLRFTSDLPAPGELLVEQGLPQAIWLSRS